MLGEIVNSMFVFVDPFKAVDPTTRLDGLKFVVSHSYSPILASQLAAFPNLNPILLKVFDPDISKMLKYSLDACKLDDEIPVKFAAAFGP